MNPRKKLCPRSCDTLKRRYASRVKLSRRSEVTRLLRWIRSDLGTVLPDVRAFKTDAEVAELVREVFNLTEAVTALADLTPVFEVRRSLR